MEEKWRHIGALTFERDILLKEIEEHKHEIQQKMKRVRELEGLLGNFDIQEKVPIRIEGQKPLYCSS